MTSANAKLQLFFEFDLLVPAAAADLDAERLGALLNEALGPMVFNGMPVITGKQLAKDGITLLSHRHSLRADLIAGDDVPEETLKLAAPHLTDDELLRLRARLRGKALPEGEGAARFVRQQALALVNEFRLVPCIVRATLTSGNTAQLEATLNITNGSVMVEAHDRDKRVGNGSDAVTVEAGAGVTLEASCAGHTISGPVIEVPVAQLARHRDALIIAWQGG